MTRASVVALAAVVLASIADASAAPPQGKPVAPPQGARDSRPAPPPTGTGAIVGTVIAGDTGRPVRRVHVVLSSTTPAVTLGVTTTDDGGFKFDKLPAGEFTLTASRPGFLDSMFGQKQAGSGRPGTPIVLAEAQKIDRVSLPIARGGVLTGTVVDDRGEPEFGAQVRAMRWVMRTGERTLSSAGSATTDDRGMYRITGLVPGDYLVSATSTDTVASDQAVMVAKARAEASASGGDLIGAAMQELRMTVASMANSSGSGPDEPTGYAPVFYPGTTQPSAATTVTLGVSEERSAVDLSLQLVPLVRISGIVTGAAGQGGSIPVTLTSIGSPVPFPGPRTTRLAADGSFTFSGVAPGNYNVMAETVNTMIVFRVDGSDQRLMPTIAGKPAGGPDLPIMWASTDVAVDGHPLAPLALALQPGLTMTGRIVASGSSNPPDFTRVRASVAAASGASPERNAQVPPATADASGHFTMNGLVPGRYRLNVSGIGSAWTIASAIVGGRDVMDMPLDVRSADDLAGIVVTLTDRSTTVAGRLQDASGQPGPNFTVVVFPSDTRFWLPQARRIQATRPGTDGRYSVRGLPPGDYRIAVVPDVEPGQWYDPAWLQSVAGQALSITLAEGQQLTQDLRIR
jgi:hypothetical protein